MTPEERAKYIIENNLSIGIYPALQADIVNAIRAAIDEAVTSLQEVCEDVLTNWFDKHYPESVFDGSSGDEGALEIVRIRNMLRAAIRNQSKGKE